MLAVAWTLFAFTQLAQYERNPAEVERWASEAIELATRLNLAIWPGGIILRGWARSAAGNTAEGISLIEGGIEEWRATGSTLLVPYYLTLKAEALHFAGRTAEAVSTTQEAQTLVETSGEGWWSAEIYRLRGVLMAALGAGEPEIEAAFCDAIRTAQQQKSISLMKRAEASYAAYRSRRGSGPTNTAA